MPSLSAVEVDLPVQVQKIDRQSIRVAVLSMDSQNAALGR